MRTPRAALIVCLGLMSATLLAASGPGDWTPDAWRDESTIELRTVSNEAGEHWFPVWLVVLDGNVYVRLGPRAAERIRDNTTAPYIGVKVAGREFDQVKYDEAPSQAERVAKAMADKYWSDILVHLFSHPMTLRLAPEKTTHFAANE